MAKKQKITDPKDIEKKVTELKIELLKQPTKKKSIKNKKTGTANFILLINKVKKVLNIFFLLTSENNKS